MSGLDVVLIVVGVVMVLGGLRDGFARRSLALVGWVLGAALLIALSPRLLERVGSAGSSARLMLGFALLLIGGSIGATLGRMIGSRLRRLLERWHLVRLDRALGGVAGLATVVFTAWIVLPAMADVPGWSSRSVRESAIARTIVERLGAPPDGLDGLASGLGLEGLPRVFDSVRPAPSIEAPPQNVPLDAEALATVRGSVVKISGEACGKLVSGSAVVVGDDLLVTNAHVVAGVDRPSLYIDDRVLPATVVRFDPARDVAVVRSAGVGRPTLPWANAVDGGDGAAVGFPLGGPQQVVPARISQQVTAEGRDIYDDAHTSRQVLIVAATLQPGDSGGALVDAEGRLTGLVFAIAPDRAGVAYALAESEVAAVITDSGAATESTDTGRCTR